MATSTKKKRLIDGYRFAEFAVVVEAAREQVMQQAGFHLPQLGHHALRFPDRRS